MKARFFTLSMLLMLLNACTSIKDLAEQGRYDEVITKGAKKLRGKDLKDPNVVALIESSFNKANIKDLNLIQSLYANNDWRNNEKVLRITKAIAARQNIIKPFLPLIDSKGYVANFNLINTEQINELATKNIVEDLYQEGAILMEKSIKSDFKLARQAYQLFEKIEQYKPDFKDLHELKSNALRQGQSHVLVNFANHSFDLLPNNITRMFLENLNIKNDSKWVTYHFDKNFNENADYKLQISLGELVVSPERINDTYHHFTQEVLDGFSYKLDAKGNVMKDSSGNDIKIPKYKKIFASIREVNQIKEAIAEIQIQLIDNQTGTLLERKPIKETSSFANYAVMYTGDKRALPENWSCKIGGYVQPFPSDLILIDQLLADVGNKARSSIERMQDQM